MKAATSTLAEARSNVGGMQWPPVLNGPAGALATLVQHFEATQWLPPENIRKRQHERLLALASVAYQFSPYFKKRMDDAGLTPDALATPEGLRRLPVMDRREAQQNMAAMTCRKIHESHLPLNEIKTSGSTAEPLTLKKTAITELFWQANMMREHLWHKRDFKGRLLVMRGTITAAARQKSWGLPADLLFESGEAMGLPVTTDIREQLRIIREFKPEHLIIYPNNLAALITLAEKESVAVGSIKHIWSICETLTPELRRKAEAFFNCSVEDDYSSQEIGIMTLQCPESGLMHVMAESVLLEVLDKKGEPCGAGETGKIVVTDLNNHATPMIRYVLGDYAEVSAPCRCGRGLPTLAAVRGRSRNLAIRPDGSRHWPPLAVGIIKSKLPIQQFQLVQHSLEEIEVRLVTPAPLSQADEHHLGEQLTLVFAHPFRFRYSYFEGRIPPDKNGKFEDFICLAEGKA